MISVPLQEAATGGLRDLTFDVCRSEGVVDPVNTLFEDGCGCGFDGSPTRNEGGEGSGKYSGVTQQAQSKSRRDVGARCCTIL